MSGVMGSVSGVWRVSAVCGGRRCARRSAGCGVSPGEACG